jgi:hypothetical protein
MIGVSTLQPYAGAKHESASENSPLPSFPQIKVALMHSMRLAEWYQIENGRGIPVGVEPEIVLSRLSDFSQRLFRCFVVAGGFET